MFCKQCFLPATSTSSSTNKKEIILRRSEVLLRFGVVIMSFISALTVGIASQTERVVGLEKTAKFIFIKALIFLVTTEGILAGYSLLQGFRCVSGMYKGSILTSKPLAWVIFSCDQMMTYISLAAAASAAESAYIAERGITELNWIKVCVYFKRFCFQTGGGVVMGFLAGVSMVVLSGMSAYNLFRLYGSNSRSSQQL
ncbi:hypothetical protein KI387_009430, partial [Taxus chinensis]